MSYIIGFLLWSYLIYHFLRFLMRLLAPFLLRKMSNKMNDQFNNAKSRTDKKRNEGEVTIDKMPKNKKNTKSNIGDYVDYEEIE